MKIWGAFLNFKHAEFKNINAFLFILIPEIAIPRNSLKIETEVPNLYNLKKNINHMFIK